MHSRPRGILLASDRHIFCVMCNDSRSNTCGGSRLQGGLFSSFWIAIFHMLTHSCLWTVSSFHWGKNVSWLPFSANIVCQRSWGNYWLVFVVTIPLTGAELPKTKYNSYLWVFISSNSNSNEHNLMLWRKGSSSSEYSYLKVGTLQHSTVLIFYRHSAAILVLRTYALWGGRRLIVGILCCSCAVNTFAIALRNAVIDYW